MFNPILHPPSSTLVLLPLLLACAGSAFAGVRYVDANSASPTPPYTNWATAAHTIQDAVDAAAACDEIVVTNGLYATGGRAVGTSLLVNRVAVDKPLTLRSVNGPEFTVIQGYQVPGTINGDDAIRCAYLANGVVLAGFTLTHGATQLYEEHHIADSGGGVWCEGLSAVVSNCVLTANSADYYGGGAYSGTLNNCTLSGNSADPGDGAYEGSGGGAYSATLNNCVLTGNSAGGGGGSYNGTLNHCMLTGNLAENSGGGAHGSTLNHCTLSGNSAGFGGGAEGGTLNHCVLTGNSAGWVGGGAYACTLNNCLVSSNSAYYGGGAFSGTLNNCTLTRNSAAYGGGVSHYGVDFFVPPSTLNNCIVYLNTAADGPNYPWEFPPVFSYCCTTPMPANGVGNITNAPLFVDYAGGNLRLQSNSPCINTGNNDFTSSTDLDGNPRIVGGAVDMGAYENQTPTFNVRYVWQDSPSPAGPYESWASAAHTIQDAVDVSQAGDHIVVTNGLYATGGRVVGTNLLVNRVAVDKPLTLRSVNGTEVTVIQGYQVPGTTNGDAAVRCVYLADGASLSGFTLTDGATRRWASGGNYYERDYDGGGVWCEGLSALVSNCVLTGNSAYKFGGGAYSGTLNNCTLMGNSAGFGGGASGWFEGSTLNNCVLTGNSADMDGGGAYWCMLNNCTLTGNTADSQGGGANWSTLNNCTLTANSAGWGGGAYTCGLNNCVLSGNHAHGGGGAAGGWLNNCTLTGNSAGSEGGGVARGFCSEPGTLNNCIVYFNTAPSRANYESGTFTYSSTTPLPTDGVGNITNAPLFVDYATGNLRLQSSSPCINAGFNGYAPGPTDLDGNPRIVSGTVDIGAYEYQGPGSLISYAWLQHYGLPTDGSADSADPDGDSHNTWQEWRCQTCPTNALSTLRLLSASPDGTNVTVSWQSVAGVSYSLECSTNLSATPRFTLVVTNLPGQPGTTTYTDTNAVGAGPFFYRIVVQGP